VVDVRAIRQQHIGNRAAVLVLAEGLKRDFLAKDQFRRRLLGACAECLPLLRAVDPVEPDAFGFAIVQNFDRIAVEDGR
jgi:hypothetical protein